MPELESQLERFAAAVLDDVDPVTADEVVAVAGRARRSRLLVVAVGAAAAVALVAAVLAVRDDTQTVDTVGPAGAGSWVELLGMVPDTPEARSMLMMWDPAERRALRGEPPPGPETGDADVAVGGYFFAHDPADVEAELGFDHRAVDQVVEFGQPPHRVVVVRGRFDRDAVAAAVAADPVWSPMLEERSYEGVPFWSWGEDYELNDRSSPLRGPGNSARLALVDDLVVWTTGDPELEAVLDAVAGRVPTMADDPDVRLAAEEADRRSVVSGGLVLGDSLLTERRCEPAPCPDAWKDIPEEHLPVVHLAGETIGTDGEYLAVNILVYGDEAAAQAAVGAVRERAAADWRDLRQRNDLPADAPPVVEPTVEVVGRIIVVLGDYAMFPL